MKKELVLSNCELRRTGVEGFTLIEMIVVITIMLLLLGFTLVGYSSYNDKQKVKQAALTLKSDLGLARTNATSGKKPVSCASESTFDGYKVTFLSSSYTIVPQCAGGDIESEQTTVTLPLGISITSGAPSMAIPFSFLYYPLTQGVSLSSGQEITLTNGTYSVTLTIDSSSGEVSE